MLFLDYPWELQFRTTMRSHRSLGSAYLQETSSRRLEFPSCLQQHIGYLVHATHDVEGKKHELRGGRMQARIEVLDE